MSAHFRKDRRRAAAARRIRRAAALLALCLTLAGCALRAPAWQFTLETRRDADDYTARDGTMLSWYAYELPRLTVEGGRPGAEPPAEMTAACEAFNAEIARCRTLLGEEYHALEQLAIGTYIDNGAAGFQMTGQRFAIVESRQTDRLLCVRADGCNDWGGAHPVEFTVVWNFDLASGAFVTWRDLTDRPDALRAVLASEMFAQIGEDAERYFPNCAARVETLEGAELYFAADGVYVVFQPYTIAPYAAGLPQFTVPWEKLAPYWNEYGKELLKPAG